MSSKDEWLENMEFARKFSIKEGCQRITFRSRNPKIIEYSKMCGFVEDYKKFHFNVGDINVHI